MKKVNKQISQNVELSFNSVVPLGFSHSNWVMLSDHYDVLWTHTEFERTGQVSVLHIFLPNETLAGTALRSIQKDTQDHMTIRVAGK